MAKVTVREFAESVGLNPGGTDYIGAGVMLRLLEDKGLATTVKGGKRQHERGRPNQLYEIADSVYQLLGCTATVQVKTPAVVEVKTPVEEVEPPAMVEAEVPVLIAESQYHWDDEDE